MDFSAKGDYVYTSFEDFTAAYAIMLGQGEHLYSPGYFERYNISRQLLYTWSVRDKRIRRLLYVHGDERKTKTEKIIFIPESDVLIALRDSPRKNT